MTTTRLIVHSETGFTQRYGQWIGEELGVVPEQLLSSKSLSCGMDDLMIIGAPVHGGELVEARRIRRLAQQVRDAGAKVAVFATGITPASDHYVGLVRNNSGLSDEHIAFFYLPGGFDPDHLTQKSKTALYFYRMMIRHRRERTPESEVQLDRTNRPCDFTERSLIEPLVIQATSALVA